MILAGKQSETRTEGVLTGGEMSLDISNTKKIMMMFTENLYSNKIGSCIRETVSNAIDTHQACGQTDPVIVTIKDNWSSGTFTVEDFGEGISPERQKNVVMKYGASTKEANIYQLGCFGVGFKSPLAYADSFLYVTRWEGTEYTYTMYKGEDLNHIDLISESPTTERNGTKVIITIKNRQDVQRFIEECKSQLCYFENVYFDVPGIANDFTITKTEDWKHSSICNDRNMHLCLDNVYYPMDWNKLKINPIAIPVGLNFKVSDGLSPVPSRESIQMSPEVVAMILDKIKRVATYFINKYNDGIVDRENFLDVVENYSEFYNMNGNMVDLRNLEPYSDVKKMSPTVKGINLLDIGHLYKDRLYEILNMYEVRGRIQNRTFTSKHHTVMDRYISNKYYKNADTKYILCKEKPKGVQLAYIKQTQGYCLFVYSRGNRHLGKKKSASSYSYQYMLDLWKHPKNEWRQRIQEYQSIEKSILDKMIPLESLEPTKEWLEERKANRAKSVRNTVAKEQINPKWAESAQRGDFSAKFVAHAPVEIGQVAKLKKKVIVWGTSEDKTELDELFNAAKYKYVAICLLSDRDAKKVEGQAHFISIKKFMEGDNRKFKQLATGILLGKFIESNPIYFKLTGLAYIKKLSLEFGNTLDKIAKYTSTYDKYCADAIKEAILEVAKSGDYWDTSIYSDYLLAKEELPKFNFITALKEIPYQGFDNSAVELGKDLLKYRKVKLNLDCYNKPEIPFDLGLEQLPLEADELVEEFELA